MHTRFSIGIFSTYVPRPDGIATFTRDVVSALRAHQVLDIKVGAISDQALAYPSEVAWTIDRSNRNEYQRAAERFNNSDVDVVLVEHEFGIFGGAYGRFLVDFFRAIRKPIVITLHTVPFNQTNRKRREQLKLLRELLPLATRVIVPIPQAVAWLKAQRFSRQVIQKTYVIPHGVEMLSSSIHSARRDRLAVLGVPGDAIVLTTFGLLTPSKGIQHMLVALRHLIRDFPQLRYIIAGQIRSDQSPAFMNNLKQYVAKYQLEPHVVIIDRYLTEDDVERLLLATDIFIAPYTQRNQVSSGSLVRAMAAGIPVISTPFPYARYLLAAGRGKFVPYASSEALANAVAQIVTRPARRNKLGKSAANFAKQFEWSTIGMKLLSVLTEAAATKQVAE